MFRIDAHLDLSMNALEWNRDLRMPIEEIRDREKGMTDKPDRGQSTVCFEELRKGDIGIVVATQIARYVSRQNPLPGWNSPEQAWAQTQGQLAWYNEMECAGHLVQINDKQTLESQVTKWMNGDHHTIGYVLSLEGADSLVTVGHLERAFEKGLRAIGLAHYGPGRYAQGTDATGGLGPNGKALLKEMENLNIIMDATHLCDDSFWEALEAFNGKVWASHNNCRKLVNHNRQFNDDQIRELIRRGAVIGSALDAWMIVPEWVRGVSTPKGMNCSLDRLIDHMDHICQVAGNALHIGIGSDLDGAFGREQSPYDLDTIADLELLEEKLRARGYDNQDIENVMHGNWLRFLRETWAP